MRMSAAIGTAIMSLATTSPIRTPASYRSATISMRPAVTLTPDDLHELGELLAKQPVQGERYNAQMMKTVNR